MFKDVPSLAIRGYLQFWHCYFFLLIRAISKCPLSPYGPFTESFIPTRYDSSSAKSNASNSNGQTLPPFDVFFNSLYNHLEKVYKQLLDKTSLMAPLLIKVEEVLVATRTQRAPRLSSYYLHWEKELFEAVGM